LDEFVRSLRAHDHHAVGARVGHHEHVALVDSLPAADAGTVKAQPLLKNFRLDLINGESEVLLQPRKVHEPQVNELYALLLDECQNVFCAIFLVHGWFPS